MKRQNSIGRHIMDDVIPDDGSTEYWRALFYYNVYRFCIAIFLTTASLSPLQVGSLGGTNSSLFIFISISYAPLALITGLLIYKGTPHYITICRLVIITDIIVFVLLIYTSGGLGSGLELLLVITVAASGILMGGRSALATAAFATLFLFGEHLFVILNHERKPGGFTAMGFMGLGLFITAFFIHYLTTRLRLSEVELTRQQANAQNLNQLNQYIINKLPSGILVIDGDGNIWLDNQRARSLLGMLKTSAPHHLSAYPLPLINAVTDWRHGKKESECKIVLDRNTTLLVHFQSIESHEQKNAFIILLDDLSKIEKESQNNKLIAMGRLSSSIAHEIRNPLGAISHAGQLLAESEHLHSNDGRLAEIINTQSSRVNRIIQTTLELGRPSASNRIELNLHEWLFELITEYKQERKLAEDDIELTGNQDVKAIFDPEQMRQVIINLMQNGLQYADPKIKPLVNLVIGTDSTNQPQLRICDSGLGIPDTIQERVFEPFFTTSSKGSGLGLYLARQLCISNNGSLEYISDENTGYFNILLSPAAQDEGSNNKNQGLNNAG